MNKDKKVMKKSGSGNASALISTVGGNAFTLIKYAIVFAMVVFVLVMIRENRGSKASFEELRAAVEGAIDQETMHDAGRKGFRRYYNLNEADFDGILLYQSVSGMSAEEVLLVKLKDPSQAETVKAAIEKHRESRINDFSGYAPEEAALLEQAQLLVRGEYLLFLPYSQADAVKQAFQGVF